MKAKPMAQVILSALLAGTIATSSAAVAFDSSTFNNQYADPLHPFCERKISVAKDKTTFHFTGTDVAGKENGGPLRGCSSEEIKSFPLVKEGFDGKILEDRISVGDGIHEGVWESKNTVHNGQPYEEEDGIRWQDGNKWIVQSQARVMKNEQGVYEVTKKPLSVVIGEYIFYSYIGFSTLAGAKGVADGIKRNKKQL
jgi:hypothetical protein